MTHRQIALRIVQEWRASRQCYVHLDYEALVNAIEAVLDAKKATKRSTRIATPCRRSEKTPPPGWTP
jgi:hypothetical protein